MVTERTAFASAASYTISRKQSPAVICQKCNFLLECYTYKYLGQINGRRSYILQRHCIDHCYLKNCPHKDEPTVELTWLIPPPDFSSLIENDGPQAQIDMKEQCAGTQQV